MKQAKTKILYLITNDFWGGAQKYVCDLSKYFHNNIDVTVAFGHVDEKRKMIKYLASNKIKYHILKNLKRRICIPSDLMGLYETYRFIKQGNFDIVHTNSSKAGFTGRLAAWMSGVKKIYYTAHGWVFNEKINIVKKIFYQSIETLAAILTTKIFCVSQSEYDLALAKKIAGQDKLVVTKLGVDVDLIKLNSTKSDHFSRQIENWKKTNKIIGSVGNFFPSKNTFLIIEIANQLINIEKKPFKFILIGDGILKNSIKHQIDKYQLNDHIILTGFTHNPAGIMKYFDLFLLTSTKEGFPYTILEAGILKIPVLSSNVGGIGQIIVNQKTGILFDRFDAKSISEQINQIFGGNFDIDRCRENLYRRVLKEYNLKKTMSFYKNYYNR